MRLKMSAEELKYQLIEIFGNQVTFNKEFDKYAETIKNVDENLIVWCNLLKEGKINPQRPRKLKDNLVFIKKIGSSNRCIVIKIKNEEFKEIHLADHEYYDRLRKKLGLKINSKKY